MPFLHLMQLLLTCAAKSICQHCQPGSLQQVFVVKHLLAGVPFVHFGQAVPDLHCLRVSTIGEV